MAQKYRTAKRIILAVFLILFSFIVIMAFIDSWKTGIIWIIAALFLFILFRSYNSNTAKRLSLFVKITLILMFIVFFGWGATYLPKGKNTNRANQNNKEQIANKPIPIIEEIKIDSAKLNSIQNKWAAQIIKEWNGSYIEDYKISENLDIIYFQLTEKATRGNWKIDAEIHQSIFQDKIDSLILSDFKEDKVMPETQIVLIPNEGQAIINSKKAERQELIARQFSIWNGAHRNLQDYIKENMNNRDCYEHISTDYSDEGHYIVVNTKIRGCNAFGAKVIQLVRAEIDIKGNILSIN